MHCHDDSWWVRCDGFVQIYLINTILRFQPKAGPDGGDGGRGGSIFLIADYSLKELGHVPKYIKAKSGGKGREEDCKGKSGPDLTIKVLTKVYDILKSLYLILHLPVL